MSNIPDDVKKGIEEIKDKVNLEQTQTVVEMAVKEGLADTAVWVQHNEEEYLDYIEGEIW